MGFAHRCSLQKCQLRRVSIYSRGQSPRYGCRLQIPVSCLKKHSPHTCQLCRHSLAGGNLDLRFSEIFNDYCSVGCVHGYGLRQYQLRRVSIYSRRQSYGNRLQIPASRLKNNPHLSACFAVILAQAGIQASDFQKYSAITAVWALPTDAVCRDIGLGRAFMFYRRSPPYFQTTFLVKSNVQK